VKCQLDVTMYLLKFS